MSLFVLDVGGPVVGRHLDDVMPVFLTNFIPEKDPEIRLRLFVCVNIMIDVAVSLLCLPSF